MRCVWFSLQAFMKEGSKQANIQAFTISVVISTLDIELRR